ncbi:fimbrillin family protein [Prevotella sp. P2-180]|uniref:fimbrillin family protein n=1 Tax=Prevotella sp. P2-180 TaxID=2024224 RepID=UPI0015554406|nr:fimbrillin family protein [Prevotella sp. P2-180]
MNKIIFWTMAAMAFLLASCAGEEEVTTPADSLKGKPINVDVLVSDIKTRAGYDTDNLPTKFYLTIDQNDTEYDYTNVVMKYEEGKWVAYASDDAGAAKKEMIWANATGTITVQAATFSLSDESTPLNALTDQSTADGIKASDHLYYSSNAVKPSENGTISIPFDHIMSKLEIKVTLRTQYGASEKNPITSAIAFGSATSATYSHAGETPWSNYNSAVSNISLCPSGSYSAAERTATYEAILIPQTIDANTFGVKVKIGDKTYTWKSANAVTFEGGMKYTLDLTLGKDELTLNTISVSSWNEKTVTGLNAEHIPYVTFTAESEQTFTFSISANFATALGENEYFEYSVGGGEWTQFKTTVDNIKFGGTLGSLRLRGKSSKGTALNSGSGCSRIKFTTANSPVDCTGDIRTLIDYENYADVSTADAKFCSLFYQNTELRTAPKLPATTLANYCYREMFTYCTALTTAPELPAKTLAEYCYCLMFSGCTALTTAPALPAKSLAKSCYFQMFNGCTALTMAPTLPAETLAFGCYQGMFSGCTALETAPALPATKLAVSCYQGMFSNCTALSTAPALPAETLAIGCYQGMFSGCTALETAPALPAETLAEYCYAQMFSGCSALETAPKLPATTLANYCYREMFTYCTALTTAPTLPAETLASFCYQGMFSGCSALTTAPELPADTLAFGCYNEMFSGCTALSSVTMLATDVSAEMCLENWLYEAGTYVQVSPTLTLYNSKVYNEIMELQNNGCNYLPEIWRYKIRYKYQ